VLHDGDLIPPRLQALKRSLAALHEPRFRRLFFGRVLSMLGTSIVPVALAFAVIDDLHGSATDLGLVLGARWLALTVLTLAGGVWADRLPRNVVMLSADLARMASQTTVGVLLVSGHAALWELAVTQTISGAGDAFFNPASTGIVPHVVPPDRLQQANAFLSLTSSGTSVIGPAIGGALVATAGAGWAFIGDGVSFLLSALFLAGLHLPRAAEKAEPTKFLADLRDGWREFRAQTWMVAIDAWAVIANMVVIAPFFVLGPLVAKRDLGGASAWAVIVASFSIGAVAGDLTALVYRPRRPLVVGCLVVTAVAAPLVLLAAAAPTAAIAAGGVFAGFGLNLFNTLFVTTTQEQVPPAALSRVTAYDWLASVAFIPLGYAVTGPLSSVVGTSKLLYTGAIFNTIAACALLALPSVRGIQRK
jgi:MFS family permease